MKIFELFGQSEDDTEDDMVGGVIAFWIIYIVVWLLLNIIGTIYTIKISKCPPNKKAGYFTAAIITCIIGWLGIPILNITAPIIWATANLKQYCI